MYVNRVRIENIRGFGDDDRAVDLDLARPDGSLAGWTVIAGRNGAGKSTFLRAIALSIAGPLVSRSLQDSFGGWVRDGTERARVATSLSYAEQDRFQEGGRIRAGDFWTGIEWVRDATGPEPRMAGYLDLNRTAKKAPERGPWAENPQGWLLAGYGPFRRLSGEGSAAQRLMSGPRRLSALVTLFREDASLFECVEWLRNAHMRALEGKAGAKELLDNILRLLRDELLPPEIEVSHVDSDGLWVKQGDIKLPLSELSDGYRTAGALVTDLARQMFACFGEFHVQQAPGGGCVVDYPGIVLVDEMDVHLHVSWQQRIGFWLKRRFPRLQFIVSTHSPFICQAADPKGLIRLPAPGEEGTAEHVSEDVFRKVVHGTADEAVLTALFGLDHTRSETTTHLRDELSALRAKQLHGAASPNERRRITQLQKILPLTPSGTVESALDEVKALLGPRSYKGWKKGQRAR